MLISVFFSDLTAAMQFYNKGMAEIVFLYALFIGAIVVCFGRPFPFGGFRWTKSL